VILNLQQIADEMKRPLAVLTKFLSVELGTKATVNSKKKHRICKSSLGTKKGSNERPKNRSKILKNRSKSHLSTAVLNGKFTVDDIENCLVKLGKMLLICPKCSSPGTRLVTKGKKVKKADLRLDCGACGHTASVVSIRQHKSVKPITKLIWDMEKHQQSHLEHRTMHHHHHHHQLGRSSSSAWVAHHQLGDSRQSIIRCEHYDDESKLNDADDLADKLPGMRKQQHKATSSVCAADASDKAYDDNVVWRFTDTGTNARKERYLAEFGTLDGFDDNS